MSDVFLIPFSNKTGCQLTLLSLDSNIFVIYSILVFMLFGIERFSFGFFSLSDDDAFTDMSTEGRLSGESSVFTASVTVQML